jgi:hydroxyacylglutathione hydrolase
MSYSLQSFPVGAFQCNCTLLIHPDSKETIVVDPGDEPHEILDRIEAEDLKVKALWHTHAHLDHIGATKALFDILTEKNAARGWAAPTIYLHEGDRWLYENVALQSQMLGLHPFAVERNFSTIKDGDSYEGFEKVKALHTPGHTPGSCCLNVSAACEFEAPRSLGQGIVQAPRVLLSGDTLFRRSIGRSDLWGGDGPLLIKSIRSKLFGLAPNTMVIPGHGPITSIEEEVKKNPFLT